MTDEREIGGAFVKLFDETGYTCIVPEDEPRIDAAVELYLSTGETRDTLLMLTMLDGETYKVRASQIRAWMVSTPQSRLRTTQWDKHLADESKANRQAVGLPWEEDA